MEVMVVEVPTEASLLTLPVEMLDKIFSYVETRDMRSIRRVCQRLNEILNRSFYCEHEIIFWRGINNARFIKLLTDSQRSVFNLYIDTVNFDDDFVLTFFRQHGSKVHSLAFRDCIFPRQVLENIIRECTALRSFSFENSEKFVSLLIFDDFCSFERESIVLEGVTSLTFILGRTLNNYMNEPTFRRFISIFPNVKQVDIRISVRREESDCNSEESDSDSFDWSMDWPEASDSILSEASDSMLPEASDSMLSEASDRSLSEASDSSSFESNTATPMLTNSSICDYIIRISKNLESLRMNLPFRVISRNGESLFEALSNLNHLCWDWRFSFFSDQCDIMKWRTQLQRIPFLDIRKYSDSVTDLLRAFKVKHLTTSPEVLSLDSNLFFELLQSEVQTLELTRVESWTISRSVVDSPFMRANTTLTDLCLKSEWAVESSTVALCLEYFKALVHLRLEKVSNRILQSIFLYQKNLRSLYLNDCELCTVDGFAGTKNRNELSIRELQNLEHLTIISCQASILASKRFKEVFQLPRLKYLYVDAGADETITRFKIPVAVFRKMNNLEALKLVNFRKPSFEELASLCKNLKKLRYLCHAINKDRRCRTCILDLSESTFDFEDLNTEGGQSYYDDELKKIVLIEEYFSCRFFSPRISSFVINWIMF